MKIDISPELAERIQRQVDCGNYSVYTDENLHELFDDVKRRGRWRKEQEDSEMPSTACAI